MRHPVLVRTYFTEIEGEGAMRVARGLEEFLPVHEQRVEEHVASVAVAPLGCPEA